MVLGLVGLEGMCVGPLPTPSTPHTHTPIPAHTHLFQPPPHTHTFRPCVVLERVDPWAGIQRWIGSLSLPTRSEPFLKN